jgi:pyruvate formate lyase activating enzyme
MTLSDVRLTNCSRPAITDKQRSGDIARIFNIQRYSLNDGEGIRTVVFFKGCPHRCPWCSNPESMSTAIHTVKRQAKCLHCQPCLNDPAECPAAAMELIGRDISLEALLKDVLKDDVFFRTSGGGVTLSGGEVLMQADFAARFLTRLKQLGVNTAIETAGDGSASALLNVAGQCDLVLFDFKIMDAEQAKRLLNVHLARVLDNFTLLVKENIAVIPRVPLIPGYTMTPENFQRTLDFLSPFALKELHLLPFHQYGEAKYQLLHRQYLMKGVAAPDERQIAPYIDMARSAGYAVTVGG